MQANEGALMVFRINHLHIKAHEPRAAADWFVEAFKFRVLTDETRASGDRFVRCMTEDDRLQVNFSSARDGEPLADGFVGLHLGLEHFGIESSDVEADVKRLLALGAELTEGPRSGRGGQKVAFMHTPNGVRIELMQPPPKQ
jgi:lactoylglutathione lyase